MLTMAREEQALLDVVQQMWRFNWDRFLVGWCAAFHLAMSVPLALAPVSQIINAGTEPVFDLASRYVWAALFLAAGLLAVSVLHRPTPLMQFLTWITVLPLGGIWLTAFVLAVRAGEGSAVAVTVWPFLYGPWAVAGVRIALGKR